MAGNADLARALAQGLLQADARDPYALLILTAAETALGNPGAGRRAGRQAWLAARGLPQGLRYDIARHTALAAMHEGRLLPLQFWLRRAVDVAPTAADSARSIADYQAIRANAKLHMSADLTLTPSDNLNDGAAGKLLSVDDWFVLGTLSGSAQALSGLRADGRFDLTYRLGQSATAQTRLGFGFAASVNQLSAAAKIQAPDIDSADLNHSSAEISLTQDRLWPRSQQPVSVKFALGQSWAGGAVAGPYARLQASTPLWRADGFQVAVQATVQRAWRRNGAMDAKALALQGEFDLGTDVLNWGLALHDVAGSQINQDYQRGAVNLGYSFGKPFGPVTLAAQVTAATSHYDHYSLLGAQVVNGRRDRQLGASLEMTFQDIGFLGYAPKLSVSTVQTKSNISRFEGHAVNIALGISSQF